MCGVEYVAVHSSAWHVCASVVSMSCRVALQCTLVHDMFVLLWIVRCNVGHSSVAPSSVAVHGSALHLSETLGGLCP